MEDKRIEINKILQDYYCKNMPLETATNSILCLFKNNYTKPKHKGKWKCTLCNRDTFDQKTPHNCIGGFRKRGIKWEEVV